MPHPTRSLFTVLIGLLHAARAATAADSWHDLPPPPAKLGAQNPPFTAGQFQSAEIIRIARGYYALCLQAHRASGGRGFIELPDPGRASAAGGEPTLLEHAGKLSGQILGEASGQNESMAALQSVLHDRGQLLYHEVVAFAARGETGASRESEQAFRTSVLNFVHGRTAPLRLPAGAVMPAGFLRADLPAQVRVLAEERVPGFARVFARNLPGVDLRGHYQVEGPVPLSRPSQHQLLRPAAWDPLASCGLGFTRSNRVEIVLIPNGIAEESARLGVAPGLLAALWADALAAEGVAADGLRRLRPHLMARRLLDQARRPRGPERARDEFALAAAIQRIEAAGTRQQAEYERAGAAVDAESREVLHLLVTHSLLHRAGAEPARLRATARFLETALPAQAEAGRLLAESLGPPAADAGSAPRLAAWAGALRQAADTAAVDLFAPVREGFTRKVNEALARRGVTEFSQALDAMAATAPR